MKKKGNIKKTSNKNQSSQSSGSMNCSCEILYDTDLSNVSNTDCSCSECLQANLNAFNQFSDYNHKNQQSKNHQNQRKYTSNRKPSVNSKNKRQINGQIANDDQEKQKRGTSTNYNLNKWKSTRNIKKTKRYGSESERGDTEIDEKQKQYSKFQDSQDLNEFLLITKNRTRNYINQRRKLLHAQKHQKDNLKEKIKHNLQILKYTAKIMHQKSQEKNQPNNKSQASKENYRHKFKWNHSTYKCLCNQTQQHQHQKECCAYPKPDRPKAELNTNLQNIKPTFREDKDKYLKEARQKRLKKINTKQEGCQYDKCQNHHMRTEKQKIKKIQAFILKKCKEYKKKQREREQQRVDRQKIKQAKLRAIQIKSKKILEKSKKYDNVSRTSFKNSIDNFATFSELREAKQQRLRQVQFNEEEKGKLAKYDKMQKIQQIKDERIGQMHKKEEQKSGKNKLQMKKNNNDNKEKTYPHRGDQQLYGRIVRDAQIYAPKNIKQQDKLYKKEEKKKEGKSRNIGDIQKEVKRKKKVQEQIQRKKKEIFEQFQRRNISKKQQINRVSEAKNKNIRQEYEKKVKDAKNSKKIQVTQEKKIIDPYRNVYKTNAGKDIEQVEVEGDPLLQQFLYHEQLSKKSRAQIDQDRDIYIHNLNTILTKQKLSI